MTLPSWDPWLVVAVLTLILIGGIIKGAIGIGLPAFSMSTLPIFIDPALAVALLTSPIICTNCLQFFSAPGWKAILRKFAVAGVAIFTSITVVSLFLADVPSRIIGIIVGLSLIAFVGANALKVRLPVTLAPQWQLLVGVLAGITGGLSAVKTPVMIYCAALNLPRDTFVAGTGFLFLMGGLGMLVGQTSANIMTLALIGPVLAVLVVAIAGFQIGARIRTHINAALFRKLLLGAMLILGLRQIWVNLV